MSIKNPGLVIRYSYIAHKLNTFEVSTPVYLSNDISYSSYTEYIII